jgi:glutaredoxin
MKNLIRSLRTLAGAAPLAALAMLLSALPAQAQYKVVGPDGRVTYTDTPPPASSGSKVTRLGDRVSVIPQVALPLELRQAASRYPVTLYTMKICEPCDAARQFLRQRGVPHTERLVQTGDDGDALQRLTGGRDAPTLTIGAQVLRGLNADTWNGYLDSAGYPRESRLPANYQFPAATPLTEPPPAPATAQRRTDAPVPSDQPSVTQPSPSGIRF